MHGNDFRDSNGTAGSDEQQERKRTRSIQSSVEQSVYDEIQTALKKAGLGSVGNGTKLVMLAFARSKHVRRAFRQALALVVLDGEVEDAEDEGPGDGELPIREASA